MVNHNQVLELVKKARELATSRNFTQSAELTLVLKDIDIKKGFSFNEVVAIPHNSSKKPSVCVIATGDMGSRARNAGVDAIMDPTELDRLGSKRKDANPASIWGACGFDRCTFQEVDQSEVKKPAQRVCQNRRRENG